MYAKEFSWVDAQIWGLTLLVVSYLQALLVNFHLLFHPLIPLWQINLIGLLFSATETFCGLGNALSQRHNKLQYLIRSNSVFQEQTLLYFLPAFSPKFLGSPPYMHALLVLLSRDLDKVCTQNFGIQPFCGAPVSKISP